MTTALAPSTAAPLAPPPAAPPLVVPLSDAGDARGVGGKAANLARMIHLGAPVPGGVALTTAAFEAFLDGTAGLRGRIEACLHGLDARDPGGVRQAAAEVHALVLGATVPEPVLESLLAALRGAPGPLPPDARLAVRSSAVGEDSALDSYAGQLDSVLGVRPERGEIARALLACWASLWSERALWYRLARGLATRGMGVVVQRLVEARLSGVLFTSAGPAGGGGGGEAMVVEYCGGLGEALVSGRVDPGRFTIGRADRRVARLAAPSPAVPDEDALFEPGRVAALAGLGLALEQAFGGPQDVEWAMDAAGRLHVVQSRPITAPLTTPPPAPPRPTVLWSNANVNENFPEPISPLLYSVAGAGYEHYFRNLARAFGISRRRVRAMEPHLRRLVGVHGARLYYNLTSLHAVLRMAPFGEALTRAFNRFVGASQHAEQPPDAVAFGAEGRARQLLEVAVIAVRTAWQYLLLGRRVAAFERAADAFAARTHPDRLRTMPAAELSEALRGFMEIRTRRWLGGSLADAAAMVCYGALEHVLAPDPAGGPAAQGARHNTLLKALPDVVSSIPAVRLWELSRLVREDAALRALFAEAPAGEILDRVERDARFAAFRDAFRRYLDEWGFRCSAELMLTVPSFQEEPAPVIELVRAYATVGGTDSPASLMRRQERERLDETARVLAELGGRRLSRRLPFVTRAAAARVLLRWTHAAIAYRERARLKQALLYSRCRRIALALGERLAARHRLTRPEDAFFLTAAELDELAAGGAMFPDHVAELVALRRRAHAELSAANPPDAFALAAGEYLPPGSGAGDGDGAAAMAGPRDPARLLSGTSACGGVVTGRAAVLRDVSESHRLSPGDVLVTRQTDPGWGPVFFLVSGLVIERGGMLSHGAIIAREFGLPCVVGVRDASRLVPHGATITVNGDDGHVRIHESRDDRAHG